MAKKRSSKKKNNNGYDPRTDPNNLTPLSRSGLYEGGYSQRRTRYDDVTVSRLAKNRVVAAIMKQGKVGENVALRKANRLVLGTSLPRTEEEKRMIRNSPSTSNRWPYNKRNRKK